MSYYHQKRFVVSGAAGGLGRQFCRQLLAAGARVAGLDLPGPALKALQKEMQDYAGQESFLALPVDLRREQQCRKAVAAVARRFGKADGVIQNAGITHRGLFRDSTPEDHRRVMKVNYFGAINLMQALLPYLQRPADVVALSSVAGFAPLATRSAYAASKHAFQAFFETLRVEEPELFVLVACPSFIDTGARQGGGNRPGIGAQKIGGRPLTPELAVQKILAALQRRKRRAFLTPVSYLSFLLQFVAPGYYDRKMRAAMADDLTAQH
ncbi:MAG: SDR family NAD(P)-dependent oxidoreductase [Leptospirales bacterium]|nr:SDR family NAD(P)-dependent oxidoreductase [Leptospirales bacterium]